MRRGWEGMIDGVNGWRRERCRGRDRKKRSRITALVSLLLGYHGATG